MTDPHDLSELAQGIPTPEAPTPQVRQRAKEHLMNHINSTTGSSTTSLDARRSKRSRRRTIGIGALATAAAVTGLVLSGISINGQDGVSGPAPAGAAALLKLSKIAASTDLPGSGDIIHAQTIADWLNQTVERDGTSAYTLQHVVRDVWVSPDRTWTLREERDGRVSAEHFGLTEPDSLFYDQTGGLPSDFNALKAKLTHDAREGGASRNGELFTLATDALRETAAGSELRASLFRIVSEIPGIKALGTVQDSQGRPGIGFRYVEKDGSYHEAIFDPQTSAMLGDRDVWKDGRLGGDAAYMVIERVSEVPASVQAEVKAQALAACGDPTGCVSDSSGIHPASTYKDTGH